MLILPRERTAWKKSERRKAAQSGREMEVAVPNLSGSHTLKAFQLSIVCLRNRQEASSMTGIVHLWRREQIERHTLTHKYTHKLKRLPIPPNKHTHSHTKTYAHTIKKNTHIHNTHMHI